jgi:hypothetical protein
LWPVWTVLVALALAGVVWDLARRGTSSWGERVVWVLVVALLGS